MEETDRKVSIRLDVLQSVKSNIIAKQQQAGFKSLTEYLLFMGLGDPPRRKAPTKERVELIKLLAESGRAYKKIDTLYAHLSKHTVMSADLLKELKAIREDIGTVANAIHDTFGYDS